MKNRKINTVPYGKLLIILMLLVCIMLVALSIILICESKNIGYGILVFAAIISFAISVFFTKKFWNTIYFSAESIQHGKQKYNWNAVFVTMNISRQGRQYIYHLFFDNHYLTLSEIQSNEIKRNGFYIQLTKQRIIQILSFYRKKVEILENHSDKISALVIEHNKKYY